MPWSTDTNVHTALIMATAVPEATQRHRLTPIQSLGGPAGQTRGVEPSLCAGGLPLEASVLNGGAVSAVHHESRTLTRQRESLKQRRGEPLSAPVPLTWCAFSPHKLIPDTHSWFSAAFPPGCLGSPGTSDLVQGNPQRSHNQSGAGSLSAPHDEPCWSQRAQHHLARI